MASATEPYLDEVHAALPRVLASFDTDPLRPSFGFGDRAHWAWKLIDFANATPQGLAHGLAVLTANGLLPPSVSPRAIRARIRAIVDGTAQLVRADGSLEEAFPNEGSFCVTALIAFDLLCAAEQLADPALTARTLEVVAPMIGYLRRSEETHGLISNHLATAVAALLAWGDVSGAPAERDERRARELWERIAAHQSREGWFREYEGADPGYQTLALYYLADVHARRPGWGLADPLARSLRFLVYAAHPDGSFGGLYGSRNTRFIIPAGLEALAHQIPEAAALSAFARRSIAAQRVVTPRALDAPNLPPFFNAYCRAAASARADAVRTTPPPLPYEDPAPWRRRFDDAGLAIANAADAYTVLSWHKGGVCVHVPKDGRPAVIDAGVAARLPDGGVATSQAYDRTRTCRDTASGWEVDARLSRLEHRRFEPLEMIALRAMNLTVMRSPAVREWIKRRLVRMLITGQRGVPLVNRRSVELTPAFAVRDAWVGEGAPRLDVRDFSVIHMASQGYWQIQDDAR